MNIQTIKTVATSPTTKMLATEFAKAAAVTAGAISGLRAGVAVTDKIAKVSKLRVVTEETPENES